MLFFGIFSKNGLLKKTSKTKKKIHIIIRIFFLINLIILFYALTRLFLILSIYIKIYNSKI